ncbi:hypothetical protein [Tuberibacillus sp. Marseille-P3662]|uniref:hypothetical protein n=1 Tax=Tuberibacillus sp. Marseille-P3662 TaxID=1965358 RepID=UPI000A1CB340|nr:hypothetical protein [Tuberibacillus sp. Marseille-P3662]
MNENSSDQELLHMEHELKEMMGSYLTKSPSSQDTQQLIERLQPEMDDLVQTVNREESIQHPSIIKQCKNQFKQLSWPFWIGSAAIFFMLYLMMDPEPMRDQPLSITIGQLYYQPLSFVLPIYLVLAFFYTFRSWNKHMRMVESVTPFPPALILLCRMLNVFVITLGFIGITVLLSFLKYSADWHTYMLLSAFTPPVLIFSVIGIVMLKRGIMAGFLLSGAAWVVYLLIPQVLSVVHPGWHVIPFIQCGLIIAGLVTIYHTLQVSKYRYCLNTE